MGLDEGGGTGPAADALFLPLVFRVVFTVPASAFFVGVLLVELQPCFGLVKSLLLLHMYEIKFLLAICVQFTFFPFFYEL